MYLFALQHQKASVTNRG